MKVWAVMFHNDYEERDRLLDILGVCESKEEAIKIMQSSIVEEYVEWVEERNDFIDGGFESAIELPEKVTYEYVKGECEKEAYFTVIEEQDRITIGYKLGEDYYTIIARQIEVETDAALIT